MRHKTEKKEKECLLEKKKALAAGGETKCVREDFRF